MAYSIAPQTTANLRLVWVGVQAIEQKHPKQTANFHCKQWRLTFDGSVSFGWVQTRPEICGAIEYALGSQGNLDNSDIVQVGHSLSNESFNTEFQWVSILSKVVALETKFLCCPEIYPTCTSTFMLFLQN